MSDTICIYGCVEGFVYVPSTGAKEPCPTCKPNTVITLQTEEVQEEVKRKLVIPEGYNIEEYIDETIVDTPTVRKFYSPESINNVKSFLSDLLQTLYNKRVGSKHSIYLHAPQVDIKSFMYSYLVRALEEGLSVAPLLSVNMLYTIQKSRDHDYGEYAEVYNKKKNRQSLDYRAQQFYEGYSLMQDLDTDYHEILTSDVLVLEATANTTNVSLTALADILAEREIRNRATIVLGYWSSVQINSSNGLTYILQPKDWKQPRKNKLMVVELVSNSKGNNNNYYKDNKSNNNPTYNAETAHLTNTQIFKPTTTIPPNSGLV